MEESKLQLVLLTTVSLLFLFSHCFKIDNLNLNFNLSIKNHAGNSNESVNQIIKYTKHFLVAFMVMVILIIFISTPKEKNALLLTVLEILLKANFS